MESNTLLDEVLQVGKIILRGAADNLKRVTLELGGKSPNIILKVETKHLITD